MKLGVVGLPNVGKSTLFNAITHAGAQAANFPFCTIEPNVGIVAVPDERIDNLGKLNKSKKISNGNFGGKTLTVNTNDVVLENVDNIVIVISEVARGKITLINCSDVLVITIKGGEELSITDSSVKEINVNDDNSSINLVNDTNVEKINVSQKGTAINSETTGESEKAPVISELNVAPTVDNVDVSGGTIENVVINEAGAESAPTVTVTGGITIEKVESKDETGATKPGNIVVSDNAKDDVVLPEGVTPITIKSISLGKGEGVKYSYEVGDVFDYTDLAVVISLFLHSSCLYRNGSWKVHVQLHSPMHRKQTSEHHKCVSNILLIP